MTSKPREEMTFDELHSQLDTLEDELFSERIQKRLLEQDVVAWTKDAHLSDAKLHATIDFVMYYLEEMTATNTTTENTDGQIMLLQGMLRRWRHNREEFIEVHEGTSDIPF